MPTPLSFGLVGAGWIGAFHADTLARRLPNAHLTAVADPQPGAAERLSAQFAHFVDCVHAGADARVALEIALAARESVETAAPVVLNGVLQ
jgi:predicted dehydrogenase